MSHKNAEVLRAIAEERPVQWLSLLGIWHDWDPNKHVNPFSDDHLEWRAKPTDKATMFWNEDDSEECHQSLHDLLCIEHENGAEDGAEFIIQRAKRLPDLSVQLIVQPDGGIDWIELGEKDV